MPTTQRRKELELAVRQGTNKPLSDSCRLSSCKPINVSSRNHGETLLPTLRFSEFFGPLAWA